jgi:Protein of unknown function (DUF4230)
MRKFHYIFWIFIIAFGCDEEKSLPSPEIYQIREIGELSTTEYVFSKVLRVDDPAEWYKFGDRKILLSCKAKVKVGIDLKSIRKEDIVLDGNKIIVQLPSPKITSFNMEPNSVRTEVVDVDGFRSEFSQKDINEILQMGEKSIRADLVGTGIYAEAEKNAVSFIRQFYQQMGYADVIVKTRNQNEK